jgi:hypothetical protein
MTDNDPPAAGPDGLVNFDAPAILRKWPSLNNQRRTNGTARICCSHLPYQAH